MRHPKVSPCHHKYRVLSFDNDRKSFQILYKNVLFAIVYPEKFLALETSGGGWVFVTTFQLSITDVVSVIIKFLRFFS